MITKIEYNWSTDFCGRDSKSTYEIGKDRVVIIDDFSSENRCQVFFDDGTSVEVTNVNKIYSKPKEMLPL